MNQKPVKTRFAPSPTGYLHIGGARTALYAYLIAKKHNGKFVLRIEDTDRERSTPQAIQAILDGMQWLGLNWDEGPYYQTQRFDLYNQYIEKLLEEKKAYPCFCTAAELAEKREKAQAQKIKYRYDRTCYHLSEAEQKQKLSENIPHCIRFYSENEGEVVVDDKIKGRVSFPANELDDLIIRRTDGSPTYNFTVVIDDALMEITHVIRGDDHLNNTPRQIQLYEALGFDLPVFAHCPMILGDDKKKLSKRHGATSVMAYKDMGYLPQAIRNYLVRLGWGHGDQEIFSMEEMIQLFCLENISPSQAVFNTSKLQWLNQHYIKESDPKDLAPEVRRFLEEMGAKDINGEILIKAISISREKGKTLREIAEYIDVIFMDVPVDEGIVNKIIDDKTKPVLKRVYEELGLLDEMQHDKIHRVFEKVMAEFDLKLGKVANPVRVALSGKKASPGAYDLLELLGKEASLLRIQRYI